MTCLFGRSEVGLASFETAVRLASAHALVSCFLWGLASYPMVQETPLIAVFCPLHV